MIKILKALQFDNANEEEKVCGTRFFSVVAAPTAAELEKNFLFAKIKSFCSCEIKSKSKCKSVKVKKRE